MEKQYLNQEQKDLSFKENIIFIKGWNNMARNRMIKPEFWEDSKIALLSDKAKLLFIALWNFADDEGFLENNKNWIAVKCFPYEKNVKIEKILAELFKIGVIFEKNGIIQIKNFLKHQKINRPIKSELSQKFTEHSLSTHGALTEHSLPKKKLKEVKEKKEKEKEKESKPVDNFQKPTQTQKADFEKAKAFGETPNPLSSFPNQNDKTAETANDQLPNDKTATAQTVPKNYRELIDYLISNFAYPVEKAKLVANRVQTDKFDLKIEQIKSFANMDEKEIILMFDTMAKIKNLQRKKFTKDFEKL